MTFATRFAPSPTGPLHLGHAYSAMLAFRLAKAHAGEFLLRIEDIDQSRARPEWVKQIYQDLTWLGISWPSPPMFQSQRGPFYENALKSLWDRGLLYLCTCTRKDITAALSAPQEGTPIGPDGIIYPGTCRSKAQPDWDQLPERCALRLNAQKSLEHLGNAPLTFNGLSPNTQHSLPSARFLTEIGDVVLARKEMGTSYHLSVVLDDAEQGITHVVRGQDLFEATFIHVLLQRLLGLPTPLYWHHDLIRDDAGKRLAKRDDARAIASYRDQGLSPKEVLALAGL